MYYPERHCQHEHGAFEHYSELERTQGVLDAGCDQFGGEVRPELLVQLVEEGKVSMDSKSRR